MSGGTVNDSGAAAGDWETVWQGRGEIEAELVAAGLRHAGINAVPQGGSSAKYVVPPMHLVAWRVEDLDDARDYLRGHDLADGLVEPEAPDDFASRAR